MKDSGNNSNSSNYLSIFAIIVIVALVAGVSMLLPGLTDPSEIVPKPSTSKQPAKKSNDSTNAEQSFDEKIADMEGKLDTMSQDIEQIGQNAIHIQYRRQRNCAKILTLERQIAEMYRQTEPDTLVANTLVWASKPYQETCKELSDELNDFIEKFCHEVINELLSELENDKHLNAYEKIFLSSLYLARLKKPDTKDDDKEDDKNKNYKDIAEEIQQHLIDIADAKRRLHYRIHRNSAKFLTLNRQVLAYARETKDVELLETVHVVRLTKPYDETRSEILKELKGIIGDYDQEQIQCYIAQLQQDDKLNKIEKDFLQWLYNKHVENLNAQSK